MSKDWGQWEHWAKATLLRHSERPGLYTRHLHHN